MTQRISYKNFKPASETTSAIGRKLSKKFDTMPEICLRHELWKRGLRYRKNVRHLPGKPDVVFIRSRVVVFCDGDFWHGNHWRKTKNKLQKGINSRYWIAKIERNMERDREQNLTLKNQGWTVLRFWESEINKDIDKITDVIYKTVKNYKSG